MWAFSHTEFISILMCVRLHYMSVCAMTYGDEERMKLSGFLRRLVAAQRYSECLAAVCRRRENPNYNVFKIKKKKNAQEKRQK